MAEVALLAALIGPTVKLRWKLSLQIRGDGPARIIAADYYAPESEGEPARIRAWASFDAARLDPNGEPFAQIGKGYLAILIDQGEGTTPYQGITPLAGGSLATCAETYFAQSEQIPTRFALAFGRSRLAGEAERWRAGGVMMQSMPKPGMSVAAAGRLGRGRAPPPPRHPRRRGGRELEPRQHPARHRRAAGARGPADPAHRPPGAPLPRGRAPHLRLAAGGLRLLLLAGQGAPVPVDLLGQGHRPHDHRGGHRHRRLPVLRRPLRVRARRPWASRPSRRRVRPAEAEPLLRRALAVPRGPSSDFDLDPQLPRPTGRELRPAAVLLAVDLSGPAAQADPDQALPAPAPPPRADRPARRLARPRRRCGGCRPARGAGGDRPAPRPLRGAGPLRLPRDRHRASTSPRSSR